MNRDQRPDPGTTTSLRQIADARLEAVQQLAKARASDVDPHRVTFGGDSPVRTVHAATFFYFDLVRPYRLGAPELWENEYLGTMHVPQTYDEDAPGDTSASYSYELLDDVPERVDIHGLSDLDSWRNRALRYREGVRGNGDRRRVWLSIDLLQTTIDALSDALVRADLAAEIPEKEVNAEPV